jgi:hypothetical protein
MKPDIRFLFWKLQKLTLYQIKHKCVTNLVHVCDVSVMRNQ